MVPLRPLTLGDIFGGAIATVRRNPKATVGLAAVVTFLFMLVPSITTFASGAAGHLPSLTPSPGQSSGVGPGSVGLVVSAVVSAVFGLLSSIVVTGLIVRVVEQAITGRRCSAAAAWAQSRGRLLPLLGLTLVVFLGGVLIVALPIGIGVAAGLAAGSDPLAVGLGVLGGLGGLVGCFFLYTRYVLLAAPSLVLEGRGILASFARAGELSRRDFWRLFGIYLLANLAGSLVSQVISIPFGVLGLVGSLALPENWALPAILLSSNLSTVLVGALVGPFTASVHALQYYDQRFRKEGLDIELLNQSLQPGPR